MEMVGVYHEKEASDYTQSEKYLQEKMITHYTLMKISGELNLKNIYRENDCTPAFRKIVQRGRCNPFLRRSGYSACYLQGTATLAYSGNRSLSSPDGDLALLSPDRRQPESRLQAFASTKTQPDRSCILSGYANHECSSWRNFDSGYSHGGLSRFLPLKECWPATQKIVTTTTSRN